MIGERVLEERRIRDILREELAPLELKINFIEEKLRTKNKQ